MAPLVRHAAPGRQRRSAHPPADSGPQADERQRVGHDGQLHAHSSGNPTTADRAGAAAGAGAAPVPDTSRAGHAEAGRRRLLRTVALPFDPAEKYSIGEARENTLSSPPDGAANWSRRPSLHDDGPVNGASMDTTKDESQQQVSCFP